MKIEVENVNPRRLIETILLCSFMDRDMSCEDAIAKTDELLARFEHEIILDIELER